MPASKNPIILFARTTTVPVELFVNDLPVLFLTPGICAEASRPVNQYLRDRENVISIVVRPGPNPSVRRSVPPQKLPASGALVRLSLARYERGVLPSLDGGEPLASLEWSDRQESQEYPAFAETRVNLGSLFGPSPAENAEPLSLDAHLRSEVGTLLKQLHEDLSKRKIDSFIELCRRRYEALGRSYATSAEARVAVLRDLFEETSNPPNWAMTPLEAVTPDLRLVANSRAVECVAIDGEPILRDAKAPDGSQLFLGLILARINGRWSGVA